MRTVVLGLTAALLLSLPAAPAAATTPDHRPSAAADRAAYPSLAVKRVVRGLDHPWDVRVLDRGVLIYTQRDRARLSIWDHGHKRAVRFPSDSVWVSGETGLTGLALDPEFAQNRRLYTCQGGFRSGGRHDVRVMAWRLNAKATRVTRIRQLVGGFPTTTGRHAGCRLLIDSEGSLFVGTGDAVIGTSPQNLRSFGGKTLRLDRFTGRPWPTNPYVDARARAKRYVFTYGHRNVQGLAQRSDGTLWSIEQGTDCDDEVNRLLKGGNYGWDPAPGYGEYTPMTDRSLPGRQIGAVWSSGDPTLATSGGGFVHGPALGAYDGTLAVAALKAARVLFLTLSADGDLRRVHVPRELRRYGRIRTVVDGPGSTFYVTTDNGNGADSVLRVRPRR
ncbi:PQQ-dependent sugar dehydrogenase [Nocardioides sp. YIM 152315]|uniref:PQQ-dependent sugar dehydrogenase n=1 Tax=Nocardioides sp. YIM 152315 TaxID=3031760 RepID=UPI0023DA30AD|nr:PQQ-dependent sugar dehydrogenase [Nocardioides sp. YIM 152315]MDF1604196.1 PQQ-dependent sugar dehydrogenase [Nocardioides sp. YIM 152315]